MNDAISAIRKFVATLNALEVEYYIGGSIASIVYGMARTTRDIDFVVNLRDHQTEAVTAALEPEFYIDRLSVARAISTGDCFNAIELDSVFQVDVFTPYSSPWTDIQFSRRQVHRLGRQEQAIEVYLASAEDTVLNKLRWFALGNEVSKLQWQDAIGVLTVQGDRLDDDYMRHWAEHIGVMELLDRARDASI